MRNPLRDAIARAAREASIYNRTKVVRLPVRDMPPLGDALEQAQRDAQEMAGRESGESEG
jgi:hypothetical protein